MKPDFLDALEATFLSARLLFKARPMLAEVDVYEESWYASIRSILEFSTGLLELRMTDDDPPFHDFGKEPQTVEDAFRQLPAFLDRCLDLIAKKLADPEFALPFPSMYIRATTFFCLSCEAVKTFADDSTV